MSTLARTSGAGPLLEIEDLTVDLPSTGGWVHAVRGIDLTVARGEVLGVVGESGAGKTVTMLAMLGLLAPGARVRGSVRLDGRELLGMSNPQLRPLRGTRMGMLFQDPSSSLNPVIRVGQQIVEGIRVHRPSVTAAEARERAADLLALMGIPDPRRRMRDYPHQLSGGMCQRAMIALALANDPDLLIADEPTTALDVTIQAQILDLLRAVSRERGLAVA